MSKNILLWSSDQDDKLVCVQVRAETDDVKTFIFKGIGQDNKPRRFDYTPGQFGTFEFMIDGLIINRCYTLSSTPTRPDTISITVKRVAGGLVSNWLHDNLKKGDHISALGPAGKFSCFIRPVQKYVFMSGGSGITPLMSMARALHDLSSNVEIIFVHCARTPKDVIFAKELTLMAHNMLHFRMVLVCDSIENYPEWNGFVGRMNLDMLFTIAPDVLLRDIYTCGPSPFMHSVKTILQNASFPMEHYHEESFSFEELNQAKPISALAETPTDNVGDTTGFKVQLTVQGKEFVCPLDQTVLQAALNSGLRWPHSCANGVCGTCKTKKSAGEVEMNHNGGIRPREIKEGWFLPCCSNPLSDLVLEA